MRWVAARRLGVVVSVAVTLALAGLWSSARARGTAPPGGPTGGARIAVLPPDEVVGFEPIWTIGGRIAAVAVRGDTAFVGVGPSVVALDVRDPKHPTRVGTQPWSLGRITHILAAGDYLHVVHENVGWTIVRAIDPGALAEVWNLSASSIHGVDVDGGHAYVASANRLDIYAIGDLSSGSPDAVAEIGGVGTAGDGLAVDVAAGRAYVADGSAGLHVFDVSDPSSPRLLGTLPVEASAAAIAVSGATAYLADGPALRIVDVSNPAAPHETGRFAHRDDEALSVSVGGGRAYVGFRHAGLAWLDVTSPGSPSLVFEHRVAGGQCSGLQEQISPSAAAVGDHLFAAMLHGGLEILDLADPASPELLGRYGTPVPCAEALAASGGYLYAGGGASGISVVDVRDALAPRIVATGPVTSVRALAVEGGTLYAARSDGLDVVDVHDPTAPRRIGTFPFEGAEPAAMAVSGGHAYLTGIGAGLSIVDARDPAAPRLVGEYDEPGAEFGPVAVENGLAYLITDVGLSIVDVSAVSAPRLMGSVDLSGVLIDLEVADGYAYIVDGWGEGAVPGRMHIVAVRRPEAPSLIASTMAPASAHIAMRDDVVLLAGFGTAAIDVSEPAQPRDAGSASARLNALDVEATPGSTNDLGMMLVANGNLGLLAVALPTVSPAAWDVLADVAGTYAEPPTNCPATYERSGGIYRYNCAVAAGHSFSVALEPFPRPAEARSAWNGRRGDAPAATFHGHPSFEKQYDGAPDPELPMRHRLNLWQPDRWVVTIESFDDTGIPVAPAPRDVSEIVFGSGVRHGLFAERVLRDLAAYLPDVRTD